MNTMHMIGRGFWLPALMLVLAACSNPADQSTEARVAEAVPTPEVTAAEAEATAAGFDRYVIDPELTRIDFVGSKVTGSHDGGFNEFEGEILVAKDPDQTGRVNLTIDMTSIWADDERLTGHLKSEDFFEVETYPTTVFESTSIEPVQGEQGIYEVTGNLTIKDVTRSITFLAEIEAERGQVSATADFFIKRFDWGIVYPGRADDLIRDEVVIRFDLTAVAPAREGA